MTCLYLNIPFKQNSVTNCTISVNHMLYNFLDKFGFLKSHAVFKLQYCKCTVVDMKKKHWN